MRKKEMNFFFKQLIKAPMLVVFVAMVCIFGFSALGARAEVDNYAIVTAMGVDLAEDGENMFELSLLLFVPMAEESFAEKYMMISSTGKNMSEALDFAGLHAGKEIGLSHIKFVVLNEEIVSENISLFLDYLVRNIQLPASTKVVVTDSTAKSFLEVAQSLDSQSSIKVSDIITYNGNYIYAIDSSMESFFKGTYGPTHVGLLSVLSLAQSEGIPTVLEEDNSSNMGEGTEEQSSENSSQNSGQSSENSSEILNNGDVIICKNGKKVVAIEGEDLRNINFLTGDYSTGSIEIFDFSDENFSDANLIFEIFDHSNRFSVVYENSIPVVNIDLSLTLRLSEVESDVELAQENVELFVLSDATKDAVEVEAKRKMASAIALMRDFDVDVADFYTFLYNNNKTKFLNFLEGLSDGETYLDNIVFKASVRVYAK